MAYTLSVAAHTGNSGTATVAVTATIPAHSVVGVSALSFQGTTLAKGSVADSNSVAYSSANCWTNTLDQYQQDNFYTLDSGSAATSVTYTLGGTGAFSTAVCVWVLTPSGGTPILADSKSCRQTAPVTGANGISTASGSGSGAFTGNFNIATASGIICTACFVQGATTGQVTAGTSPVTFSQNAQFNFGGGNFGCQEYGFSASTPAPATWATALSATAQMLGLAFDITPTGAPSIPLLGQILM